MTLSPNERLRFVAATILPVVVAIILAVIYLFMVVYGPASAYARRHIEPRSSDLVAGWLP